MSKTIPTTLTVVNEFNVRGQQILDLIKTYIPGFVGRYYGFRPLGSNDISYPAIFIEPSSQVPTMISTGKYHLKITYNIYWFVIENDPAAIVTLAASAAEALIKLFSNDALGDLQTANPPTNKFKANAGYWLDSEMTLVEISNSFINATPNNKGTDQFMRAGIMRFEIQDVVIK